MSDTPITFPRRVPNQLLETGSVTVPQLFDRVDADLLEHRGLLLANALDVGDVIPQQLRWVPPIWSLRTKSACAPPRRLTTDSCLTATAVRAAKKWLLDRPWKFPGKCPGSTRARTLLCCAALVYDRMRRDPGSPGADEGWRRIAAPVRTREDMARHAVARSTSLRADEISFPFAKIAADLRAQPAQARIIGCRHLVERT